MAKLGFLGLGLMGAPMARNLLKAGHDVALWSNTQGKAGQLAAEAGGKACTTPAEGGKKGLVVVDPTPGSPPPSRHTHEELAKSGIDFLGAPCTGSTPGAINA